MSEEIASNSNIYKLLESEEVDNAESGWLTRKTFLSSTVYIKNPGAVPVTIQVSPGFGEWFTVAEDVVDLEAIVKVDLNIKHIKAIRGVGVGVVDVIVMSGSLAYG